MEEDMKNNKPINGQMSVFDLGSGETHKQNVEKQNNTQVNFFEKKPTSKDANLNTLDIIEDVLGIIDDINDAPIIDDKKSSNNFVVKEGIITGVREFKKTNPINKVDNHTAKVTGDNSSDYNSNVGMNNNGDNAVEDSTKNMDDESNGDDGVAKIKEFKKHEKIQDVSNYTVEETSADSGDNSDDGDNGEDGNGGDDGGNGRGKGGFTSGGLIRQDLDEVLHTCMIPYSEHVLLDRALPRVEDGLKPVQRRVLYTMFELGLTPDKTYRKSAKIVGDCLGKYHPHGDSSVYDAMVRMAQPYNMGAILVQGHGNFGSMDGDSAAAMRYTEAKLTPLAMEMLQDLEKDTVNWSLNYDDSLKEPDTLPSKFPNLLVNGAMGIAVGLATNIPPHNLVEVIDGAIALIREPSMKLRELMKIVKGPDFPTGGIIAIDQLKQAYETGKGRILIRAKTNMEKQDGKTVIVITEFPYQKNKATTLAKIAEIREDKKGILLGITDIRDESDRRGVRATITVKGGYDAEQILQLLFKYSDLQVSYGINMVAIADGKPRQLGLIEILKYYINYQIDVLVRRTKFDLNSAKDRVHILEGLYIAISNIDEVIRIIKGSQSANDAKFKLIARFLLSEKQAQAILDMRLARLTSLEVIKIQEEIASLKILIEKLTAILKSKHLQNETVIEELTAIRNKHYTKRKCKIVHEFEEIDVDEILDSNRPVENVVVALSHAGTIKRFAPRHFETAIKSFAIDSSEKDMHYNLLKTQSNKVLLALTNKGNAYKINVEDIKECKWRDKGALLRTICKEFDADEKVISMFDLNENGQDLVFVTEKGMIKRSSMQDYNMSKAKFIAIKLKEGDKVVSVFEYADKPLLMITSEGYSLKCKIDDVNCVGRASVGVKCMTLGADDSVVFAKLVESGEIIIISKNGMGKRVAIKEFSEMARTRKGVKCMTLNQYDEIYYVDNNLKDNEYAIKLEDGFIKRTGKEMYPDTRMGKGKSVTSNKMGQRIFAVLKNEGEF